MTPSEDQKQIDSHSKLLSEKIPLNLCQQPGTDLQNLLNFNEKSTKWHTLNTLMIISNNKKIESLQNVIEAERARLRFVEDKSEQMDSQIHAMKYALKEASKNLRHYHRNLVTVITLLKLTAKKAKTNRKGLFDSIKKSVLSVNVDLQEIGQMISQNGITLLVSALLSRLFWIDYMIDGFAKLLVLTKMSNSTIKKTRLGMKISVVIFLFVMLRKRLQMLMTRLKAWVNYIF